MRRPLCVFCVGTLGVELVCAFLPQTGLLLPFAAFFVPALLWLLFGKNSRGYGVCLLLGALVGLLLTAHTRQKLDRVHTAYADREVTLTAEVEEVSASYYPGVVHAVLRVEPTGGEKTAFRVECVCMPKCTAGERVQARFALEVPARTQQLSSYADGIALSGEYLSGMKHLGPSESFRAKTARLQRRLSAALRKGMAQGPAGVLAAMALLLAGVTGLTPSVLRAATAVWVSALGVWLYGPPDALTSLGVAGVWMTLGNSYAVCDIGFELSFAAVLGTLAGAELARKGRRFPLLRNSVWETLCVSACASAATFPVLVLWGLSASLYALVSSVAVLWLMEPILQLGLATALLGCWPALAPLHRVCSLCAATLAGCLNRWALWVSGWPGAQIYFDTACAALVCLLLLGLGWLAYHWRVRPRVALPCLVLTAALAIGLGNVLNREIVRVELAGSRNAPAVVITRGESAVVLFRGGSSTQQAVETLLTRRGAREVEMLVDLRMNPRTPCTLEARERMAADEMPRYTTRRAHSSPAELEVLRVQNGCIVRITAAGRQFAALSGSVPLAKPVRVDWLLASPARPDAVRYTDCLTLSSAYHWMEENAETETASCLALRPGGGERLS